LLQRRAEEEWDLWLRRLRDEAYVEIRLAEPEKQLSAPESTEQSASDFR
jgi:peptidyl-prolyl cis-trans isomerase SurA